MTSTIDNELGNIETKLNNDKIRVDKLEQGINGLKGRNTNVDNQSVTPKVPSLNLQNISQDISPNSTPLSSQTSGNKKDYHEVREKDIRRARYNYLINHPNDRKKDPAHVKEFKELTEEFSNPSRGYSTQRGRSTDNNTSRVSKSNTSRGGGKKTRKTSHRKTKRRRTNKKSHSHKKRH